MLYLHGQEPTHGWHPRRVDALYTHLGTLSLEPPALSTTRYCGDVVAFTAAEGVFEAPSYPLREVLFRVWFDTPPERVVLSLSVPGRPEPLAQLPVSGAGLALDHQAREQGYVLAQGRVPLDLELTGEELEHLFLAVDANDSGITVASCPSRASMVVFNPPAPGTLDGQDADGDGVDDGLELRDPRRDPFRPDPDEAACQRALSSFQKQPPVLAGEALPEPAQRWEARTILEAVELSDVVVEHRGRLRLKGDLLLDGATLLLAPSAQGEVAPSVVPGIDVMAGASLVIRGGSTVAASDPAQGFSIRAGAGAHVELLDSRFLYPGSVVVLRGDRPDDLRGLMADSGDVVVRGCSFEHGFGAILLRNGGQVEGNRFARNASDVFVLGPNASVVDNHSEGSGHFLRLSSRAQGTVAEGNTVVRPARAAVVMSDPGATGAQLLGNRLEGSSLRDVIFFNGTRGQVIRDNRIAVCKDTPIEWPPQVLRDHDIQDNEISWMECD